MIYILVLFLCLFVVRMWYGSKVDGLAESIADLQQKVRALEQRQSQPAIAAQVHEPYRPRPNRLPANYLLLLTVGGAYPVTALAARKNGRNLSVGNTLIGLQLVTAALPMKLQSHSFTAIWILEAALLMGIGFL